VSPAPSQPLLHEHDPAPAQIVHGDARTSLVLVGDHAGNAIPSALGDLGLPPADRERHIAWDLGVRALGERLASLLDATFVHQHFSRLVIDCNRDPSSPASIVEASDGTPVPGNIGVGAEAREARRTAIHEPYHARIAREIARRRGEGGRPVLIALHSFTPVLGASARPWQLGILHHLGATGLSRAMLARLKNESFMVGDNEPYRMDGTDYTVPRHAYEHELPYLEVEFRQDLLANGDEARDWATRFARWLTEAIATL
jgi:predicted N-formylglutamate amidohydrolase